MAVINNITNDTGNTLDAIQNEESYHVDYGRNEYLEPDWTMPSSQDTALLVSVTSGDVSNNLYLWTQALEGWAYLYYSTTPQGTAHIVEEVPCEDFGITFVMNVDGNTIIVGTVDTLVDPVSLTKQLVLEN